MTVCNNAYANYEYARKLPYAVINKLIVDCPEIWKLMYYDEPLGKKDLTIDEISSMICPNSINVGQYNVIFQKYSQEVGMESTGKIFAQTRIQVLGSKSINRTVGRLSLLMEFIVNDKKNTCDTDLTPYDNRALAMAQEAIKALNGISLDGDENNYLFMNGMEDLNASFKLVKFNNEFSGYQLIMNTNILG